MRPAFNDLIRIRVPAPLAAQVRACAEAKHKTVSELVREALRERVEREAA
jgi:predicted transcriptional regulator